MWETRANCPKAARTSPASARCRTQSFGRASTWTRALNEYATRPRPRRRLVVAISLRAVRSPGSRHGARSAFPIWLAQFAFQNLAGSRQRQHLILNMNAARAFVAGDPLLAEGDNLL